MAYNSFRQDFKVHARSQTPDRILSAVEAIPESAFVIAELLKHNPTVRRPAARGNARQKSHKRAPRNSSSKTARNAHSHSHSHSASFAIPPASPIDTLASVAAFEATTRSPPTFHNLYQSQYPLERSSKRARSEIAPSPQQPATSPLFDLNASHRPATSYNYNGWGYNVEQGINNGQRPRAFSHARSGSANYQESNVDEAELLLNFSRGGSISSSHGLGIRAPATDTHNTPRAPALPPFPYATSEQSVKPQVEIAQEQQQPDGGASVSAADLQSSPSPPTDSGSQLHSAAKLSTSPPHDEDKSAELSVDNVQLAAEPSDLKHPEVEPIEPATVNGVEASTREEVPEGPTLQVAPIPDPLMKPEESLNSSEVDGRRYSDSHHENPLKRVRLNLGRRSSSVPLEYAMSESTEPSTTVESQSNADDSFKLHEQGIICPSCNNAADVTSEKVDWLQCDGCDQWYHVGCSGLTAKQSKVIDKYYCKSCEPKFGKSTKKRTSSRPRTTVDYAGLNEGVLRMPGENREHHYIDSFKSGAIKLAPETFPRIPGNEITADFFEKCHSFTEPVLIPNNLNPRPKFPGITTREEGEQDEDRILVPDDGQDDMDMVIPQELTVRRVSELFGPKNIIPVIDVKAQESSKGWTVEKWADYYENPDGEPIRNVISLECSTTPLCRLIRRPKVVRDIDLQDSVWPDTELRRSVGFYVLMSVADCFTDFHIDFGGSSVYYHILKGKKVFFFIPPTPSNLQKYQEWNDMPSQTWTWLPDITKTKECYRVDLYPGDTMLIPAGWIHAVWTPDDSLVIGGNFLTRLHYGMQFRVAEIEKANKTPVTFRYPKFQKVMWYAVLQYLERDPLPVDVREMFLDGKQFTRERPVWSEFDEFGENSKPGPENFNARYYPKAEVDGFPELVNYIFRTVMIHMDRLENITAKIRKAVTDSIPKNNREPLDVARDFAMWVAWKRGNEDVPEWAHPGAVLPNKAEESSDKKLTDAQMKKLQRTSAISVPERQSARLKSVAETAVQQQDQLALASTPKTSSLGPRRTACDSCRRRKMRCKHVENVPVQSSPIIFTNPLESSPQSNFMGVVIPDASGPPAAAFPPPFQVDPVAPMANGIELQGFTPGPKQEVTELKKGRTKACYDCRRSKRRCIHDEFGKVDPIKQREPVVPRGSAKRKQGPSPEMPLAKKPANEQVAPIAPMLAGQVNTFDASTSSASTTTAWTNGSAKQDGMFRNSTVNDFSSMTGVVNVNPLASRTAQANRPSSSGVQQSPSRASAAEWVLDPALMDPELEGTEPHIQQQQSEDDGYADAQDALLAYYQSNGLPPASSQETVNQFMNGFVDYEAGQPKAEMEIDPMLETSFSQSRTLDNDSKAHPEIEEAMEVDEQPQHEDIPAVSVVDVPKQLTNGVEHHAQPPLDPELEASPQVDHDQSNGVVVPSTEDNRLQRQSSREVKLTDRFVPESSSMSPVKRRRSSALPQTPQLNGTGKRTSPEAHRTTPGKTPGRRKSANPESSVAIEETDEETQRLIEQLRQENLQTRGLRRRS